MGQNNRMIQTHVKFSKREFAAVKREAARLGLGVDEFLRRSVRDLLPVDPSKPWMRFAGMIESGDRRSSRRIDEVVYGPKALRLTSIPRR